MKLSTTVLAVLLPFMVSAYPTASPDEDLPPPPPESIDPALARRAPAKLEARDSTCRITANNVNYRTCPRTSCNSRGQLKEGDRIIFTCWTGSNTETVNSYK